jgi:DNA-binding GntR family transcriptional regulator
MPGLITVSKATGAQTLPPRRPADQVVERLTDAIVNGSLEAIEAGDAARAASAMREHIEHTSQLVETAPHDEGAAR